MLKFQSFLPQYHHTIVRGHPITPNRKSLRAMFLTTELISRNPPKSLFLFDMYKTNPLPKVQNTPINPISTAET